ncbi:MAG TPA: sulfur starvation response protein OscA [Pseudomonas sp.]|nr:sulfur starvation response protein OscA [Pseudomonas sp.]
MSAPQEPVADGLDDSNTLREIARALQGLRFGSVEITVHNSQIVQIERKEKIRLQPTPGRQA